MRGRLERIDNTSFVLINQPPEPMNRIRPILLVCVAVALVAILKFRWSADEGRLSLKYGLTQPFYAPGLNVQWAAATNALPRTVTIFEVVSDDHPDVIVSNLMMIGRFRPSDSIKGFDPDRPLPKAAHGFRAADDGRTLLYIPRQGRIEFDDESVFHGPGGDKKVEGVPDEATVLELALRLLPLLGISTNDMVRKESGALRCVFPTGSWGHTDRDTQIHRRGIGFTRNLDGKEVDGQRAVFMEFGNNAKLGKLEVHWCALRPKGSHNVAPPQQIVQWIKEGRAMVVSLSGPLDARYAHVADIRKLVIQSCQARYPLLDEDNPPRQVYPYAQLTATAQFGPNDEEQVFLLCPIISAGLPEPQRPSQADFSIYPSTRSHRGQ